MKLGRLMSAMLVAVTIAARTAAGQDAPAVQTLPPAPASKLTRLILLGTQGGPRVNADRAQSANVLIVNGTPYLIDAGNGVARQLSLARVPLPSIHQIFITHNHDDHNADWGTLMGLAWTLGNTRPITVYGPRGTESMRQGFLEYFAPNAAAHYLEGAANIPPESVIKAHDIAAPGLIYQDANIRVTAHENCHYHFSKGTPGYRWQQSFAFRFDTPDRVIVFSGDTGPCDDALADFARGADILVHEVIDVPAIEAALRRPVPGLDTSPARIAALMTHMVTEHSTPQEVGKTASRAGVRMVVLSHLIPGAPTEPDSGYVEGVKEFYSGPVVVGRDLLEF
jgi:ribonuclease BN (tRNA processing enzyme)